MTLAGVNTAAPVWGAYFPGVTGRNATKRARWSSNIAGDRHVETRVTVRLAHDADLGVRNHPATLAQVTAWHGFTVQSAAAARALIATAPLSRSQRAGMLASVTARALTIAL